MASHYSAWKPSIRSENSGYGWFLAGARNDLHQRAGSAFLSKIPVLAAERNESHPLVIAGALRLNPEPVADFFDFFVIGDGEEAVLELLTVNYGLENQKNYPKQQLLREVAKIDGVMFPGFYKS